ncbi:hypothetical protein [Paenibacillus sp. LK1]|uniref:hypothetical protein n=1 Tax=Paenibacillus sp. LK1 TaxID=2053014 RepID=UPI000C18374B|nr:hypothetical protein [Paenibacillus sp. LK1]PIH59692.1 hypothetical protein CS562_07060 [Paenibacillus sp. LK1]
MARLDSYYTDGDTLVMHMHIKTKSKLRYDVEVRIDKSQNTYTAIENGFEENEIIIRDEKLEPEYVESEMRICIQESILSLATLERADGNLDLAEYISSILDWL